MRLVPLTVGLTILSILVAISLTPRGAETAFPGSNGRIVYTVNLGANNVDLWSMNPDGTDPLQLTSGPYNDAQPAVSPDGTRVVFTSNRDTGQTNFQLHVMNIDGSGVTRLTNNAFDDKRPAWSPDGTAIAFTTDRDGDEEIYRMPAAGGPATRLTNSVGQDDEPAWSPDGTKIAFIRYVNSGEVWVMNSTGGNEVSLAGGECCSYSPDWSPGGSHILFTSYRGGPNQIYTMTAAGGSPASLIPGPGTDDTTGVWSPDGAHVAFSREDINAHRSVYIAGSDGGNPHQVSPAGQEAGDPSWAPASAAPTPTSSPTLLVTPTPGATASPTSTQTPAVVTQSPTPSATAAAGQEVVWADDNCSGSADPVDSLLTLRHDAGLGVDTGDCPEMGTEVQLLGPQPAGADTLQWGDADCSGAVDPVDSLKILRADAGLSVTNPVSCPAIGSEVLIAVT